MRLTSPPPPDPSAFPDLPSPIDPILPSGSSSSRLPVKSVWGSSNLALVFKAGGNRSEVPGAGPQVFKGKKKEEK